MTMKLSEAIRLGSMMKPQNFGEFYGHRLRIERTASFPWFRLRFAETSCAVGAAFQASGAGFKEVVYKKGAVIASFREGTVTRVLTKDETTHQWIHPVEWDAIWYRETVCPQCQRVEPIYRLIPHLNDKHHWTRERIADYVETLEREAEQVAAVYDEKASETQPEALNVR